MNSDTIKDAFERLRREDLFINCVKSPNDVDLELDDKMWKISEAFLDYYGPAALHISSYNAAITDLIPSIVEDKGKNILVIDGKTHTVIFNNPYFQPPIHREVNENLVKTTPKICIDRGLTFKSDLYLDITYIGPDGQINSYQKKHVGSIPVMVRSVLDPVTAVMHDKQKLADLQEDIYEVGGYFIIKGISKILVSQVRPSHNNIQIYTGKAITSNNKPKFLKYAETRSGSLISHTTILQVGIDAKTDLISVMLPYIDNYAIPLGVVFKALGITDEDDIINFIFGSRSPQSNEPSYENALLLTKTLEQSWPIDSQKTALEYINLYAKKNIKKLKKEMLEAECADDAAETSANKLLEIAESLKSSNTQDDIMCAQYILENDMLPHIGVGSEFNREKCIFLGYMTKKLLTALISDRDHFIGKRIHTSGMLITSQFYKAFRQLCGKTMKMIEQDLKKNNPINVSLCITVPHVITNNIMGAVSNNKWNNSLTSQGISQMMDDYNITSKICFLRKFMIPIANDGGKIEFPRMVHGAQWGISCPNETPEGKKVGIVQYCSMGQLITVGCDSAPILEFIESLKLIKMKDVVDPSDFLNNTRVFLNGRPVGYVINYNDIVGPLRDKRRDGGIHSEVSIAYDYIDNEIRIATDAGRVCRGLVILENGHLKMPTHFLSNTPLSNTPLSNTPLSNTPLSNTPLSNTPLSNTPLWLTLMKNGYVELINKEEEEMLNVAVFPSSLNLMTNTERIQYTHCEMTPDMILGAGVSTCPFPDRNQAPRNSYQANMGKQAMGIPGLNYEFHKRGKWHALVYPQKPIVDTRISRKLNFHIEAMGQNAIVAVMPWYGYNQEDSLVLNGTAIDREFMCSYSYVSHEAIIKRQFTSNMTKYEIFDIPTNMCKKFKGNPSKLVKFQNVECELSNTLCHVPLNTQVCENDIIIGVVAVNDHERTNMSVMYDHKWPATVHSVQSGYNGDGHLYLRVVTKQYRKPVIGDKFCYSPDHEVLTDKGWVSIDKVTVNDKVASLQNDNLVYENPTEIMSFELENGEELIQVSTNQVELCVTAEHKMYVKPRDGQFQLIKAHKLFDKHVHYKKDANWNVKGLKYFTLPSYTYEKSKNVLKIYGKRKIPINEWCKFYGIWLAEGWTKEKYSVQFAVDKSRVLNALKEILPIMGFEYTIEKAPKLAVHDRQLTGYMMTQSFGALNKKMDDWVWSLNPEQCRYLMEGMLLGDGHMNGTTAMYDTSSIKLKDDVMRLALHCGWAANAKIRYFEGAECKILGKTTKYNADAWRLTIVKTQLTPAVNKHIKNQQVWVTPTHRKVYCCTVSSNVIYIRNKPSKTNLWSQRPVWSGNSARSGQKGTAGAILYDNEMPYFKDLGFCPNILINLLAFPSRMTMGMLVEAIIGVELTGTALSSSEYTKPLYDEFDNELTRPKFGDVTYPPNFKPSDYESGVTGEAAPFQQSFSLKRVLESLHKMGFHEFSEERVINNITGEEQTSLVYRGVVYYQRLKHMSVDKIHARATGSSHTVTHQPTEGRKRKGGFRIGHMERDNCRLNTPIALREGISTYIGHLKLDENQIGKLWGWEVDDDLLITSTQINFGNVKKRPCFILTLQDGRTIEASKNHPFYTNTEKYSDIKYLKVNEDRLACTLCPPLVNFEKEIKSTKKWLNDHWTKDMFCELHNTDTDITSYERYRRSLILARLIGYAITDGHVSKKKECLVIYSGTDLDVETILLDIKRLLGTTLKYSGEPGDYTIYIPVKLAKIIRNTHIITGAKVHQDAFFPDFINKDTPLPILREFFGGLFGGDGHTCCLSKHRNKRDLLKSVAISWTRDPKHLDSLQKHMETLQKLLLRFGISSTIQAPKLTTNSKKSDGHINHKQILLNIPIDHLIPFAEKIGFRYCEHKAIRLAAGVSYRRYREGVLRQREWICERVDELTDYRNHKKNGKKVVRLLKAIDTATEELKLKEAILHEESIPTQKICGRILLNKNNNEIRSKGFIKNKKGEMVKQDNFPTVEEYFTEIGAMNLFLDEDDPDSKKVTYGTDKDKMGVPAFYLKVIDIREKGTIEEMCDITVEGTESYVANGVISHNCMLAQGVPEVVQDRLLYSSDVYIAPVCQICGLIAIDDGKRKYCNLCQTSKVVNVQIPYGSKLTTNEVGVLNLVPRMITLKEPEHDTHNKTEKK